MDEWQTIAPLVKRAWKQASTQNESLVGADTHIRSIGAHLGRQLKRNIARARNVGLDDSEDSPASLNVDVYLNRNYDKETKRTRLPLRQPSTLLLAPVYPAIAVHDRTSPNRNILAIEMRDHLISSRYPEVVWCKTKILSFVGRPLGYQLGLYLEFGRDSTLTEAKLIRHETWKEQDSPTQDEMLLRFGGVHEYLLESARVDRVQNAKEWVREIECDAGFEDVLADIV